MAQVVSYQTQSPLNLGFPRLEPSVARRVVGFSDTLRITSFIAQTSHSEPAYRTLMHPESVMTTHTNDSPSVSEICARVNQRVQRAVAERREEASRREKSRDQDRGKGATEQDSQNQGGNTSMQGQLGHRDEDAELKNADSDLSG